MKLLLKLILAMILMMGTSKTQDPFEPDAEQPSTKVEFLARFRLRQSASNRCVGIHGNMQEKLNSRENMQLYDCGKEWNTVNTQIWNAYYVRVNTEHNYGSYIIQNQYSNKCIGANGTDPGTTVRQYNCDYEDPAQQWHPVGNSGPSDPQQWVNAYSLRCLSSNGTSNYASLIVDNCAKSNAREKWSHQTCDNLSFAQIP